jgi:hypothetical protein
MKTSKLENRDATLLALAHRFQTRLGDARQPATGFAGELPGSGSDHVITKRFLARWRHQLCVGLTGAMMLGAGAAVGGDPESRFNLAGKSDLPAGNGFASGFPGDVGLKANEHVIFADDFESGNLGAGWDETANPKGRVLAFVAPGADARFGKRCLSVEAHLGQDTGGGLTKWFESADTIFIRFYTRFAAGCDYIHHFVTLRANKGLRGGDKWSGFGGAGLRPEGNERFSTAIEPWGDWGRWPAPGRWNFYSYWHEMEPSKDTKYWGNSFGVPTAPNIPRDRWICVEFMLKHNTPGRPDGEQAFWIDGELQGHWRGINWRKTAELKANALTLESYVTDRWTKNPTNTVFFDNVAIARRYLGPTASPK